MAKDKKTTETIHDTIHTHPHAPSGVRPGTEMPGVRRAEGAFAHAAGAGGIGSAGVAVPAAQAAAAPQQKKGRTVIIVVAIVIAAIAIWLCVWLFACNGLGMIDPNAQDGQAPYKTAEEVQAELDRVVEEGMFNISIASTIQFDDGTSDGTAYIENVPGNHYLMKVTITDEESGDALYESGVLKPNQYIEKITLTRDLEPGSYPAVATFTAMDATTYDEVGEAAAKVTINVVG